MRLSPNCDWRSGGQLYAGDLVVAAECELDLETVLDAVAVWGHKLRFEFGVGSSKSAVMVSGARKEHPCLPCDEWVTIRCLWCWCTDTLESFSHLPLHRPSMLSTWWTVDTTFLLSACRGAVQSGSPSFWLPPSS